MEFGNLMSCGPDLDELFKQSTKYVDKIVRGTNPSDLPEEFPDKICAHFNLTICEGARPDHPRGSNNSAYCCTA